MKDKPLSIYHLLDIKPNSWKMLLLLFPPIYSFWLLAIGKRLLQKQNKPVVVFSFFAWGNIVFWIAIILLMPILDQIQLGIGRSIDIMLPIMLALCFFWLITSAILSNLTIKYDRLSTPDRYYSLVDEADYIKRFFLLLYWQMGIWFYQGTVNKYNLK